MSEPKDSPVSQIHLQPGEQAVVTREGWRVEFKESVEPPCISHDDQEFQLVDGVIVPMLDGQKIYDKAAILDLITPPTVRLERAIKNEAPAIKRSTMARYGLNKTDIGYPIETDKGQSGIYFGTWRNIVDREGRRLSGEFNLFTTDWDTCRLSKTRPGKLATCEQDIQRIADLRDIFGHNGILLPTDASIYEAIHTGNYDAVAKWHMPVIELVHGRNIKGHPVQGDNLYTHRNSGPDRCLYFSCEIGSGNATSYWAAPEGRGLARAVSFLGGYGDWVESTRVGLSSRPVRMELRPVA